MALQEKKSSIDVYVIPSESVEELKEKFSGNYDKEILRYKIIFFLHNGGLASAFFYIAIIAKEHVGLSSLSLGLVLTAQMLMFTFTKPLIGYIADYFNSLKIVICILTLLNLTCFFSLFAIPKIQRDKITTFEECVYNSTELCIKCKDFLQFSQISTDSTLMISSNFNLTEIGLQCQICMGCFLKNEGCFNSSHPSFTVKNSEDVVSYLNETENNKQNCALFCLQNDSFSSKFLSSQATYCQNFINCVEKFCLQNSELYRTNQTREDGSSIRNFSEISLAISKEEVINDFYTYQFWLFAVLFTISNICENANFTLVDTACVESIERSKADFGKMRLWGNIGWGIFSPIGGQLNDYTGGFFASSVLMAALLLSFLYNVIKQDLVKSHQSNTIARDIGTVFRSKEFLSLELVNLMNGVGFGIVVFYLSWFLVNLGASKLLVGVSVAVQSFGGVIPFMFFSGWILRKIGPFRAVSLALLVNGLRFLLYSQLHEPWWVLPIEITHGVTYGLYYTALATYGKLKAKPGTEATTQSILFTTHEGLGAGIGCGFAGIGFYYFGTHQTFLFLSAYFGCDFLLSLLLYFLFIRKKKKCVSISSTN